MVLLVLVDHLSFLLHLHAKPVSFFIALSA